MEKEKSNSGIEMTMPQVFSLLYFKAMNEPGLLNYINVDPWPVQQGVSSTLSISFTISKEPDNSKAKHTILLEQGGVIQA